MNYNLHISSVMCRVLSSLERHYSIYFCPSFLIAYPLYFDWYRLLNNISQLKINRQIQINQTLQGQPLHPGKVHQYINVGSNPVDRSEAPLRLPRRPGGYAPLESMALPGQDHSNTMPIQWSVMRVQRASTIHGIKRWQATLMQWVN